MPDDAAELLHSSVAQAIARAAAAVDTSPAMASSAQQIRQQVQIVRGVARNQGLDGVKAHRLVNSAANSVQVILQPIAYIRKPSGYNGYLVSLVERWLTNSAALASTNVADVIALNERLGTVFNPANHFSAKLPKSRLEKIKAVFVKHGFPLEIAKPTSMSSIREAAKSCVGRKQANRPFAGLGVISGSTLVIGQEVFNIVANGKKDCIRVTLNGTRHRVYLEVLEWLGNLAGLNAVDPLTLTTSSIGELAYSSKDVENEAGPLPESADLAYVEISTLRDRIAALLPTQQPHSTMTDDERDPLEIF
jgi:hypothetical protein